MERINKSSKLDEKSFIMRLENGYTLSAAYKYFKDGKMYILKYELFRKKNQDYNYVLIIQEGIENADFEWGYCSEREGYFEFISYEKALKYLKEKEYFNLADWFYHRQKRISSEEKKDDT